MARILTSIHLSDIQRAVLTKVFAAPNGQVAFEELASAPENIDSNVAAARDMLSRLNLLTINNSDDTIEVTPLGIEVMQDEYLIDDMQQLTDKGNQYISYFEKQQLPATDEIEAWPTESFSLIQEINHLSNLK